MYFKKLAASLALIGLSYGAVAAAQDIETKKHQDEEPEESRFEESDLYLPPYHISLEGEDYFIIDDQKKDLLQMHIINNEGIAVGEFFENNRAACINGRWFRCRLPNEDEITHIYITTAVIKIDDPLFWVHEERLRGTSSGIIRKNNIEIMIDNEGPEIFVQNRDIIQYNNLIANSIIVKLESPEKNVKFEIETADGALAENLYGSNDKFYLMLEDGYNYFRAAASDYLGNRTLEEIVILNEGIPKYVDGIRFMLDSQSHRNFGRDLPLYESLACKINEHNSRASEQNKVYRLDVVFYEKIVEPDKDQPTSNAWYDIESDRITIGYGNLIDESCETLVMESLTHETGHKIYYNLNDDSQRVIQEIYQMEIRIARYELGELTKSFQTEFFKTFTDGYYSDDVSPGHPHDNASELFASSFMIRYLYNDQLMRRIRRLPEQQKISAYNLVKALEELPEMP